MCKGSTVSVRHATPRRNLRSILSTGLDPGRSRCARLEVWLHKPSRTSWAIPHVAARHSVPVADVVVLTVRLPRNQLVRRGRGLWSVARVVPPACIVAVSPSAWQGVAG
jgi:hypothetical protein